MDIVFVIPIEPVAKARPRGAVVGGRVRMYTPAKTRNFEHAVSIHAATKMPSSIIEGPVSVDIVAVLKRPKRLMRKKDSDGLMWCPKKPDSDNIRKAVLDGLVSHWRDDSQVVSGGTWKVYSEKNGKPRLVIRIKTMDELTVPGWACK